MGYWKVSFLIFISASCRATGPTAVVKDVSIPVEASEITKGPIVNLKCNSADKRAEIELEIIEYGRVDLDELPRVVPPVFIEQLTNKKLDIRGFRVDGIATQLENLGAPLKRETFDYRRMYGSLGFTEPKEGFTKLGIYGDSKFVFPSISIEYNSYEKSNKLSLYFRGSPATSYKMACKGTMPDLTEVRAPKKLDESPYHREFACAITERGQIKATKFSFKVQDLQFPHLIKAIKQQEDFYGRPIWLTSYIPHFHLSIFNEPGSRVKFDGYEDNRTLDLIGDSGGIASAKLSFPYPKRETETVAGRFNFNTEEGGKLWADVECKVSPITID